MVTVHTLDSAAAGGCSIGSGELSQHGPPFRTRFPCGRRQLRHGPGLKDLACLPGNPSRRSLRFLTTRAVRRDPRSCVHLPIKLREQHKSKPRAQCWRTRRSLPDCAELIKAVPHALRTIRNVSGAHARMRRKHLGPDGRGDQPVPRDRRALHRLRIEGLLLFPAIEVHRARKGLSSSQTGQRSPPP